MLYHVTYSLLSNKSYLSLFQHALHHLHNFRLLKISPNNISTIREIISKLCFINLLSHLKLCSKINCKFYHLMRKYNLKLTLKSFFSIIKSNKFFIFVHSTTPNFKKYIKVFEDHYHKINETVRLVKLNQSDNSSNFLFLSNYNNIFNFLDLYNFVKFLCYQKKTYIQSKNSLTFNTTVATNINIDNTNSEINNKSYLSFCFCMDARNLENEDNLINLNEANENNENNGDDGMVCCDGCNQWNHMSCLGIKLKKQKKQLKSMYNFYCIACSEERNMEYPFMWQVKKQKKAKPEKMKEEKRKRSEILTFQDEDEDEEGEDEDEENEGYLNQLTHVNVNDNKSLKKQRILV